MSAFGYRKPADLPRDVPLFPLVGAVLFPRGVLGLNVFEPRYLNMVDDVLGNPRLIGMIQPAIGEENQTHPQLADVGTIGRITSFSETEDGRYLIQLTGVCRFELEQELEVATPYRQGLIVCDTYADDFTQSPGLSIDRPQLLASLKAYAALNGFQVDWAAVEQAPTETIINVAAQICPFDAAAKQALLETISLEERCRALIALVEWDSASDDNRRGPLQ